MMHVLRLSPLRFEGAWVRDAESLAKLSPGLAKETTGGAG